MWAPISLVVHGLQGLLVGLVVTMPAGQHGLEHRCRACRNCGHGRRLSGGRLTHSGVWSVARRCAGQSSPGRRRRAAWNTRCRGCEQGISPGAAMEMVGTITSAIAAVRDRISAAAQRAGRDPSGIRLMAVTKGFPQQVVLDARAAGLSLFGENRVQEAEQKYLDLPGGLELHLIGHLQRNKARAASGLFACVQSIDKAETAEALDAKCEERGRTMDILLELNTSGEAHKVGFSLPTRAAGRVGDQSGGWPSLRVRGLMTVGPLSEDSRRGSIASFATAPLGVRRDTGGRGAALFRYLVHGHVERFRDRHRGRSHAGEGRNGTFRPQGTEMSRANPRAGVLS